MNKINSSINVKESKSEHDKLENVKLKSEHLSK